VDESETKRLTNGACLTTPLLAFGARVEHLRSPQLTLWTLGPDERLLFKKLPDYAPRKEHIEEILASRQLIVYTS
jgi:hypothetical protein